MISKQVRARVEVIQGDLSPAVRELKAPAYQCSEVATAIATVVAIALSDHGPAQRARTATSSPPSLSPPSARKVYVLASPEPPAEPEEPSAKVMVAGAAVGVLGLTPGPALGAQVSLGMGAGRFGVELEARYESAGRVRLEMSSVEASVISVAAVPCARVSNWMLCGRARLGSFLARALDVELPIPRSSLFGAAGIRAVYGLALTSGLSWRLLVDLEIPLVRTSVLIDDEVVWTSPSVMGGAATGIELEL
ncbi:MAG: hypothetical protein HY791_02330 [Deltaproteobacteria bacterium]|nr:hypothetical protein [Deltaproteobacteria bacterium]